MCFTNGLGTHNGGQRHAGIVCDKAAGIRQHGSHLGHAEQRQMLGIRFSVGLSDGYMDADGYPSVIHFTRVGELRIRHEN